MTEPPCCGTLGAAAVGLDPDPLAKERPALTPETALGALLALMTPVAVTSGDAVLLQNPAWARAGLPQDALELEQSGYLPQTSERFLWLDVTALDVASLGATTPDGPAKLFLREVRDLTATEQALARVEAYRAGVRTLVWHGVSENERERRRLARWLHDGAIQRLVALRWHVQLLGDESVAAELENVMSDLRRETIELHDRRAVRAQLAELCAAMEATLVWDADEVWTDEVSQSVVRVCREALLNAMRHARAEQVGVRVQRQDDFVVVEIEDDGVGVAAERLVSAELRGHIGVASCRAVVESLGGEFTLTSGRDGCGTLVRARIPVQKM